GLIASEGDRVFIGTVSNLQTRNQFFAESPFSLTDLPGDETNMYYSFLYKFNDPARIGGTNILVRVNKWNSGTGSRQFFDVMARRVGEFIQVGIAKGMSSAPVTNWAATNIAAGETVFIVVRQNIREGPSNDVIYLWVNPPTNSFGASDDNLPPASAVVGHEPPYGDEDSSGTGVGRFAIGGGINSEFDELRIGTTWADVTPRFGMCVNPTIVTPPTNVTIAAGLSATFRVSALGTGRTYQWQLSTNSGATWENIPGAIGMNYTTPLLRASDNGKQYRVIVTTPCSGVSVTSAVATLTVYEPTPTPVGIVCHDKFTDGMRADYPVGVSNSVWFASTAESLQWTDPAGLIATPASGAASLWIGYFTHSNAVPVHLGVGREIRVTFPFKPVSFGQFTNNGSVRFGLFDYYDGGVRVNADGFSGSAGNGAGVRGYLLNLNFGTNFTDNTPLELYARFNLDSTILSGAIADYQSLGAGPQPGTYSNAPAFQPDVEYTLEFKVLRYAENATRVTAKISGGGTNWTWSVIDTTYAYPRFDAFAVRTPMRETSCDQLYIPEFKVEVASVPMVTNVPPFKITEARFISPTQLKLTWESVAGVSYDILSRESLTTGSWVTNATVVATGTTTSYTNTVSGAQTYFKISVPLPQLPPP
ncbi:MAG: hypothetical protein NZ739_11410, partial [Verrucomicrobiae bacterium]|nr:hypothetical protein [Verrucomicrobiae bacterium]